MTARNKGDNTVPQDARQILIEIQDLRSRLEEAEKILGAIRSGDVDAVVVYGADEQQVYTLRGADEPYRIFVETMQEGAATLSEDGTILYCNQSFADMAALPMEKVIGSSIHQLLFGREGNSFDQVLGPLGEDSPRAEMVVLQTGKELPVQVSISTIASNGSPIYALTATDLTTQREHENQLQKANAELEGFCYSVSHDLRAPVRNIIGSASVVLEDYADALPESGKKDLGQICQSAVYLGRLIDDLLAYARLAQLEVNFQPVDITGLARGILVSADLEGFARPDWSVQDGMQAEGDESLLRMALDNLISNAVKYASKVEKPCVEIGTEMMAGAPVYFVRDNGIGFEMTYAERIFRPFERLHRSSEYPGTGIGLANVRRIIAKHGGEVWAEAHPGQGACFYFTLPRREAQTEPTSGATPYNK
jgi:PAS domain S-box-containing protein